MLTDLLQHARKKLDSRRLAYDTSLSKMEKAKKEDFRVEEELRSQKVKYEEASDDVLRRMQDIKEAEADNVLDMGMFLDAQLEYHERSREALMQLKNEWTGYALTSKVILGCDANVQQIQPSTSSSPSSDPCSFQHRSLVPRTLRTITGRVDECCGNSPSHPIQQDLDAVCRVTSQRELCEHQWGFTTCSQQSAHIRGTCSAPARTIPTCITVDATANN